MDELSQDHDDYTVHDFLAFWLHRLSAAVLQQFERELAKAGLTTAQFNILHSVYSEVANTPRAISRFIGIDIGSVSRGLGRLETKGLVSRRASSDDGRSIAVEMTDTGQAKMQQLTNMAISQDKSWVDGLAPEERALLARMIQTLLKHQGIPADGLHFQAASTSRTD